MQRPSHGPGTGAGRVSEHTEEDGVDAPDDPMIRLEG